MLRLGIIPSLITAMQSRSETFAYNFSSHYICDHEVIDSYGRFQITGFNETVVGYCAAGCKFGKGQIFRAFLIIKFNRTA